MEQHPVPQHIASYEFRLVGDMTIKQFALLAGNCLIALLIYSTGMPALIRWPLVLFFVFLGIAMAFIPLEERPLHKWLMAFLKASYSPTHFVWEKKPPELEIFAPSKPRPTEAPVFSRKTARRRELAEFLQTLPSEKGPLDQEEEDYVKKVNNLFTLAKVPAVQAAMGGTIPQPTPPLQPQPLSPKKVIKPSSPPPPDVAQPQPTPPPEPIEAKRSPNLPFPQTPQTPNLLVGMILDKEGKIIENAIVEIRNSKGVPVRALKSNKLGQFRIVTPLKNDQYEIETEKEGYDFDIIKITLKGEPVSPIEIRAKEQHV